MIQGVVVVTHNLHYALYHMRIIIFALLLLPLSSVNAGVYTWVDEEGNTHFSDRPQKGSKKVKVQESMSYTPPPAPQSKVDKQGSGKNGVVKKYTQISIEQPENEATVRSNEGKVAVSVGVKPEIQAGHKIQIFLDGAKLTGASGTHAIELQGLNRGSHSLVAAIIDKTGKELIRSASVSFHLRQHSILHPTNKPNSKKKKPTPSASTPQTPTTTSPTKLPKIS